MQTVVALVTAIYHGDVEEIAPIIAVYAGIGRKRSVRLTLLCAALLNVLASQLQHEEQAHGHDIPGWLEDMGRRFA